LPNINDQIIAIVVFGVAAFLLPWALNKFADSRSQPR
jgi:hypothetical protein